MSLKIMNIIIHLIYGGIYNYIFCHSDKLKLCKVKILSAVVSYLEIKYLSQIYFNPVVRNICGL